MRELGNNRARPSKRRGVMSIAAALLGATVLCQPDLAHAAHGGGGGGHGGGGGFHGGGGGFHGGGGGFHGGGFHGGGFHADGFHGGGFHGGGFHGSFAGGHGDHWNHGWHNGRYGWGWGGGLGWGYYPYDYGSYGYPDYGYYNYGQPYASQTWYYCSDPAGYYPYVAQCNTGWQAVPAS
jgi:hypothetical protein